MMLSSDDAGVETSLDLRGLKCPLPALRTRRALVKARPGDILDVWCSDPLSGLDIPNLVRETGDALLSSERHREEFRFRIRKAPPASGGAATAGEDPSAGAGVDPRR